MLGPCAAGATRRAFLFGWAARSLLGWGGSTGRNKPLSRPRLVCERGAFGTVLHWLLGTDTSSFAACEKSCLSCFVVGFFVHQQSLANRINPSIPGLLGCAKGSIDFCVGSHSPSISNVEAVGVPLLFVFQIDRKGHSRIQYNDIGRVRRSREPINHE